MVVGETHHFRKPPYMYTVLEYVLIITTTRRRHLIEGVFETFVTSYHAYWLIRILILLMVSVQFSMKYDPYICPK